MKHRLVGYHAGTSFLHRLSGASKLTLSSCWYLLAAMLSYDTRLVVGHWFGCPRLILQQLRHSISKDISFVLAVLP